MSYYNNAPRIFTPSALKTTKTSSALESFGIDAGATMGLVPPSPVNTCHRSRGSNLQNMYPRTFATLRQVEAEQSEVDYLHLTQPASSLPASTMKRSADGSIFVSRR